MAVEPLTGAAVELDEEIDGEDFATKNYRFSKVGESVPIIKSEDAATPFDPQSVPSQPLAVSERFGLLFLAHPQGQGFYVVRTKDVMASAEAIRDKKPAPSVQELSLVDVPIGKVSILALSADGSLLAATVASHVHFFAVSALLHKEQKPSYSVSLDDSICIKDMRWAKKDAKSYVVLSSDRKLYHGSGQGPITCVTEGVDSVDWSVRDNSIAVAKNNVVSILTSQFEEKLKFILSFQSVIGDSDVNQVIKVDSIRWIRPDSLVVGCFQLNDDGEKENYIVQYVTSRGGRITDASTKPIVLSFSALFMDFCSDDVPAPTGPHMFFSYLDLYGLAFVAIRMSRQVALFCWPQDSGKNEPVSVEILDDYWILHIDSQDNDEDNVLLGLCIDKASQNENLRFTVGDVETEVSPCCVIICLTIDGKISVFHFASAAGTLESAEGYTIEQDDALKEPVKQELPHISSAGGEESRKLTCFPTEAQEPNRIEVEKTSAEVSTANNLSSSANLDIRRQEQTTVEKVGSQAAKVDDPKKGLSVLPKEPGNAEHHSISGVVPSKGFFSGSVVGDVPRQSVNNYPPMGPNVEPLHKMLPSATTPSPWRSDLTGRNERDEASKSSDEVDNSDKSSLQSRGPNVETLHKMLPSATTPSPWRLSVTGQNERDKASKKSDEVDNSDKSSLQSTGNILKHSTDFKEKPSATFPSFKQTALSAQGHRNSLSAYPSSQVSSGSSFSSGKVLQSESRKELNAPPSRSPLTHFVQNASKQFGNVEEMAIKLDNLLEGIEGKGGFRDASITSQEKYVVELEEGIWALSDKCRMWKSLLNEKLGETQVLLEKTVEVLARKIYMEGLFKQTGDRKYWEFWNRKKLSSELELKQRRILELNQELTNKLIELETHFNSLEFNKFRENDKNEGTQRDRRSLHNRQGRSRQIQSLQSVHNTINAQLLVAEQLSGCLSKQMAALCIESSGKHDAKKQLFESIGLAYIGDNERSPVKDRTSSIPANKEYSIASGSIGADKFGRNQSSYAKGSEPQTARRHRDSLDHSWVSFDPPKSTVKRVLKEDYEKGSSSWSLLNINKQYSTPQKKSEASHSELSNTSGASLKHYPSKGFGTSAGKLTESPSPLFHVTAGLQERTFQLSPTKNSSEWQPSSVSQTKTNHGAHTDEKTKSGLTSTGTKFPFAASEYHAVQRSNTSSRPLPSISGQLPVQSLASPFASIGSFDQLKTTMKDQSDTKVTKVPVPSPSPFSSALNVSDKSLLSKNSEKPSSPNDGQSASSSQQSVLGSSSPLSNNYPSSPSLFASKPSSTLFPTTSLRAEANVVAKEEISQQQASVASKVTLPSTLPSFTGGSNIASESSSGSLKSQPSFSVYGSKTELQTEVDKMPPKTEMSDKIQTTVSQPTLATSTPDSKLRTSASSRPSEPPTSSTSGSQDGIVGSSNNSPFTASVINVEIPSTTEAISTVAPSSEGNNGSMKGDTSIPSHEEEMEEEAPETNQTTELTFANLGGFGIGPTQNSTTAKGSPFGLTSLNKDSTFATSPFTMSPPSGELFRPASFNFQPPQPLQPPTVSFSGGFGSGVAGQASAPSGFGQPAQVGAGQQALGSVLGSFGQSRQLGTVLPGSNAVSGSGFGNAGGGFGGGFTAAPGGGFGNLASGGGFAAAATSGGGFAAAATGVGGFGGAATGGGGFAAAATGGGGFAGAATGGGGFAGAATGGGGFAGAGGGGGFASSATGGAGSGGGFGAFSNQPGSGGFSSFGSGGGGTPPSNLFTQMRK